MNSTLTPRLDAKLPEGFESLVWQSAHAWKPPAKIKPTDTSETAARVYSDISQGTALLLEGDYQQARQLLATLKRRLDKSARSFEGIELPDRFHRIRLQRSQAARQAGQLLIAIKPGYQVELRRAPPVTNALEMAYGDRLRDQHIVMPLTELVGVLSAFEWHNKGLPVAALGHSIYPRWGVFAPTRHEYLGLLLQASLPQPCTTAVDVGTGTGVLAMLLAKRGIAQIIATDTNPLALSCAQDNIGRVGLSETITVQDTDLMPDGKFDLIVCNPPWLPGAASGPLETAIYDPEHRMLRGFLGQVAKHLKTHGQAWLVLSDLAEHLRLRSRESLLAWIADAGLNVMNRLDIKPTHRKLENSNDPLTTYRRAEVTSLWQLQLSSSA